MCLTVIFLLAIGAVVVKVSYQSTAASIAAFILLAGVRV